MSGDSSSLKNVGSPLGIYFSLLKVNMPQFSLLKVNVPQSFMNSTRAAMPLGVASKMLFWYWAHTFCWLFSSTYLLYKEDLDPPDCSHQLWTKCKIYNVLKNRHWELEHSKGNWSFWWGFESVIILFFFALYCNLSPYLHGITTSTTNIQNVNAGMVSNILMVCHSAFSGSVATASLCMWRRPYGEQ